MNSALALFAVSLLASAADSGAAVADGGPAVSGEEKASAGSASGASEAKPTASTTAAGGPTSGSNGVALTLRAVGDVMMGSDFPEPFFPPDGGAGYFDDVADLLRDAPFTFVNAEGPLCDSGETKKCGKRSRNCYAFRTPTRFAAKLKDVGVDVASTANNHSGDFGEVCRRETERALDAQGIAWSGPPGSIASVQRNGKKIAVIAFHTSPSCNHVNDHVGAKALVTKASADHDLVLVSFHGGAEGSKAQHVPHGREDFFGENRGELRAFARAVIDAGADAVLGHGPHVLRGMEVYKDRFIVYSLGNFATYGKFNLSGPLGVGAIVEVQLGHDGKFLGGQIFGTKQEGQGIPRKDSANRAVEIFSKLTAEDFPETGPRISADGVIRPR